MQIETEPKARIQDPMTPLWNSLRNSKARGPKIAASLILILFVCALVPVAASAKDSPARKLGRGAANLGLGVMAIPSEIIQTTRKSGPAVGATWGLLKGTGMMLTMEVVGLWEVITCPFATPPDYRPILKPEFPWQRFSEKPDPAAARKVRTATANGRRARE